MTVCFCLAKSCVGQCARQRFVLRTRQLIEALVLQVASGVVSGLLNKGQVPSPPTPTPSAAPYDAVKTRMLGLALKTPNYGIIPAVILSSK